MSGRLMRDERVLIFRPGYLGDTIVALPALRLVAEAFPDAERRVLTEFNSDPKAAPLAQVLEGTGLVHGYLRYPPRVRRVAGALRLRHEIRSFNPGVLVYLAPPLSGRLKVLRDLAFFRWCGIRRVVGAPSTVDLREPRQLSAASYEYEGARLLRCLHELGAGDLSTQAFDLKLSESERSAARSMLASLPQTAPILAASIGAKVSVKDWGDGNWSALLSGLSERLRTWSLVMVGAAVEKERSEQLLKRWRGRALNLCGETSARVSAAVLERARLFVGHDSGPMHLAAAVGTPCVAVFSSRHLPGVWFPWGSRNRVIYTDVPCRGCNLDVCVRYAKKCIASISVDEVMRHVDAEVNAGPTERGGAAQRVDEPRSGRA